MYFSSLWVGLAVLGFAGSALAEGPAHQHTTAPVPDKAAALSSAFEASIALVAAERPAKAEESRLPAEARHLPAPHQCGSTCIYREALASLVLTRDIQVPGAPMMAFRLIPSSHALAGDTHSAIVVRPSVAGSGWGFDVAARF